MKLYYLGKSKYITLTPAHFKIFFSDNYNIMVHALKKISIHGNDMDEKISLTKESLIEMQDFIEDIMKFMKYMSSVAGDKKIVLYPFLPYENGYGTKNTLTYLPDIAKLQRLQNGRLTDWDMGNGPRQVGFVFDPSDTGSFQELIPEFLGLLFVEPSAFVVRILDEGMDVDELLFGFEGTGSLQPSMIRGNPGSETTPPKGGMVWWNEGKYQSLYNKWNKIVQRHKLLGIVRFKDPEQFYDISRHVDFINNLINKIKF